MERICGVLTNIVEGLETLPEDGMLLKIEGQKNCEIKEYEF